MKQQQPGRDLSRYAKSTNRNLIIGAVLLLYLVGVGLIYWIYGTSAALMAVLCLTGGVVLAGIIYLVFIGIERIVKNANRE